MFGILDIGLVREALSLCRSSAVYQRLSKQERHEAVLYCYNLLAARSADRGPTGEGA